MVTILMYHEITGGEISPDDSVYSISRKTFEEHLALIEKSSLPILSLEKIISGLQNGQLPPAGVVLSFDDGLAGNYQHAYPLLAERGWPGVFFISTDYIGQPGYVSWDNLREMSAGGMLIGSHTCSHRRLENLSRAEVKDELFISKKTLDEKLGLDVKTMSLPGGGIPKDLEPLACEAGYQGAGSSVPATVEANCSAYALPRLAIRNDQTIEIFTKLLFGDKHYLGQLKRNYKIKNFIRKLLPKSITSNRHHNND